MPWTRLSAPPRQIRVDRKTLPFLLVLLFVTAGVPRVAVAVETVGGAAEVVIEITSPSQGATIENKVNIASIRGVARSGADKPLDFEVLIAIDVSKSTQYPSGIDVDEDGEIGFNPHEELIAPGTYPDEVVCSDPDDTILAAEVKAARMLLSSLSPGRTRVGIITFSGEVNLETGERKDRNQRDARIWIPLTDDFPAVTAVLDQVIAEGPHGATNFSAAIHLAVVELVGLTGAKSQPRSDAKRVLQFLTDGVPTFPFGRGDQADVEDTEAAINSARLAHKAGITINSFALGRYALDAPVSVTEMARLTGGAFTPVRNPGEILAFLQGVSFANIDDVVITNVTTGDISYDVDLAPDGSFSGFVPVTEGDNLLRITVLATDGGRNSVSLDVHFQKSGLTENELLVELARVRKRNKEMMLVLERKRIEAFRQGLRGTVTVEAE